MIRSLIRKYGPKVAGFSSLALVGAANAAADVTAITGAQTDLLTYIAAMLALALAVWGAMKVVKLIGR